jgi:hypothetical protein
MPRQRPRRSPRRRSERASGAPDDAVRMSSRVALAILEVVPTRNASMSRKRNTPCGDERARRLAETGRDSQPASAEHGRQGHPRHGTIPFAADTRRRDQWTWITPRSPSTVSVDPSESARGFLHSNDARYAELARDDGAVRQHATALDDESLDGRKKTGTQPGSVWTLSRARRPRVSRAASVTSRSTAAPAVTRPPQADVPCQVSGAGANSW